MTPVTDITLDVDLRNPGQFFACCGVLELASRLWANSLGWFAPACGGAVFHVATGSGAAEPLKEIVMLLCGNAPLVTLAAGDDVAELQADRQPVMFTAPFDIRLDWWLDSYGDGDKSELKVWAGQQTPERLIKSLRDAWAVITQQGEIVGQTLFGCNQRHPLKGRFGFDPSSAWEALDVGFSANTQNIPVLTSPAVEILAAIGLQRCRPQRLGDKGRQFGYRAWAEAIEIAVVPAAIAGAVRSLSAHWFLVNMRNDQYGNFGWAKPWGGEQ